MEHITAHLPQWANDLPLPAKIAALAIGVPLLAIVLNVLRQLVSVAFRKPSRRGGEGAGLLVGSPSRAGMTMACTSYGSAEVLC